LETIEIAEASTPDGGLKATSSGVRYTVWYQGEILLKSSRVPFCDAARALLAMGKTGSLQVKRRGSDRIEARSNIESLAKLSVKDGGGASPHFREYKEFGNGEDHT